MGAQGKSSSTLNSMQRVKVYRLNDDGKWDDRGTGHVTVDFLERSEDLGLFVIDEEDNATLLSHRIRSDEIYRLQEDTIISWRDPEYSTELALSFQEATGCSYIWDHICNVQRNMHFNSLSDIEIGPRPAADTLEASGTSQSNEHVDFGAEFFVSFLLHKSTKMVTVSFKKKCHLAGVSPRVYHLEHTSVRKRIRWRWAQRDVEAKINNIFNLLAVVAIKLNIDPSMFFPAEFEPIGSIDEETPDVEDGDIIKGRITDFTFSDDNSTNGCLEDVVYSSLVSVNGVATEI